MSRKRSSAPGNARACVLDALYEWESGSGYARDILDAMGTNCRLKPEDRALAKELLFGILRHLGFLDAIIGQLRSKGKLKPSARGLLRLGLYQIFKTQIADHAAVNETVSLANKHERGLVNGILRNAIRRRENLLAAASGWPLEDRVSHPRFLLDRWTAEFGAEATLALCEWNNQPPPIYARVCDESEFHERIGDLETGEKSDGYRPVEGYPDFVRLPSGRVDSDLLDRGTIYIQDPSTSVACWLLAPEPGEIILDACAAPGGKTSMLSAMSPEGTAIHATDSNPDRIRLLGENLKRLQIEDVEVSRIDWADPGESELELLPRFDAILLDVPCSNTGVMRRRVDVRWRLQPGDFTQLQELQLRILKNAATRLKPGGRIIYSTCSIDPGENLRLVESSGLAVEEVRETLPWRDGVDGAFAARLRRH